jgi:uncharacterized protein YdhG (YjbR/CyaY superfamily)
MNAVVPPAVQAYIDGIEPEHRALFSRLHGLIMRARPDAQVALSYKMPTYRAGKRRLYVAAWKHGISVYGWPQDRDDGFTARHPELLTSKGTIRLRPRDASQITDEELFGLARAALAP